MDKNFTKILILTLIIYSIISFFFITDFVHSDETWLGSLSDEMLTNSTIITTESSFDLYPRNPHAIKLIFNFIQILFIKILGNSIITLRLVSLVFSVISAYIGKRRIFSEIWTGIRQT